MNAEKYVNDIVGKIKCTEVKKKEIKIQLLSDISARMEQGESLEQIMVSMGTAQEIADAFRQDMPEAERKMYRKKRVGIIVAAIIAGAVLLGFCVWWIFPKPYNIEGNELLSEEAVDAQVEIVITLLDENDFETLRAMSVDKLQNTLTQEIVDKARNLISDDWGEREKIGSTYTQGIKQSGKIFVVTQTDVMYENVGAVYTITFDENLRLSGLYMR